MAQVTVFSTKGKKRSVVTTEANTWGELKKDLLNEGIETNNMKSIVGENQVTLESSAAVLPKGLTPAGEVTKDFTLFLTPIKVKSGSGDVIDPETMTYSECKTFIKEIYNSSDDAKEHFGNYTIMSTNQMRSLIESWLENNSEELEDASPIEIIDNVILNLQVLKSKIQSGEITKEAVVDEIAILAAWYEEIEANM
jgi:hypothetical protein